MELSYDKYPVTDLLRLLPTIEKHMPVTEGERLRCRLEAVVNNASAGYNSKLAELVDYCAANSPKRFGEYLVHAMLSMAFDMTKLTVTSHTVELKNRLLLHAFQLPPMDYSGDFQKIYVIAESLWSVSSSPLNIKHMVSAISHYNRFTYNVSIALICAALNQLVSDTPHKFRLANLALALTTVANTSVRMSSAVQFDKLFRFLALISTLQDIYWFNYDRPALHPDLATYIECDWQAIDLRSMLDELQTFLCKSARDGQFTQQQTLMNHLIDIVLNNLNKMAGMDHDRTDDSMAF